MLGETHISPCVMVAGFGCWQLQEIMAASLDVIWRSPCADSNWGGGSLWCAWRAGGRAQPPAQQQPRRPTLLQKLLAPDIRREHSRLLQCLRFLVNNNFLLDFGRAPLVFPPEPSGLPEAIPGESICSRQRCSGVHSAPIRDNRVFNTFCVNRWTQGAQLIWLGTVGVTGQNLRPIGY